ncbi:hypothetical protein SHAM105786_04125 [Shewanella amazonensis]|uniref:Uncharacterized protein n=1 Tax=Shewanella amazonensis (strain ATCC BAA-1098 / SB2B) TaxID=326297 RepID=A1S4H0_SHEAM|nr:hypothetical protein [Shewanella amazonensis]ABL99276.1 hypothetical protein Sama_1069 [Shewanella amazonensis SB2B]
MKDSQLVDTELKQTLDALYREGAREEPPEALDAEILALAGAHLASPKPEIVVRRGLRRFPYAISSAASLMLLVGLVLLNPQQVFFNADTVLPETDMLVAPMADEGMVRTEMNANARNGVSSAPDMASSQPAVNQQPLQIEQGQQPEAQTRTAPAAFSSPPTATDESAEPQVATTAILKSSARKLVSEPLALRPDGLADTDDIDLLLASLEDTLAGGDSQLTLSLIEAFIAREYELTAPQQLIFDQLQSRLAE